MTTGPRPTPTALKLVKGNPGKRATNQHEAVVALAEPSVKERIVNAGMAPGGGTAAAFKSMLDTDMKKWGGIIKRLNIQLD